MAQVISSIHHQSRQHGGRIAVQLPFDQVLPPDLLVGSTRATQVFGKSDRGWDRRPRDPVPSTELLIALALDGRQRQNRELKIQPRHQRQIAERGRGVDARVQRVLGQIRWTARRLILPRGLGPESRGARQIVPIVDQRGLGAEIGGLARQRGGGVQLAPLDRVGEKIVVVLHHVEFLIVRGHDPNRVQVSLRHILERPRVLAHAQEHAVAIEGALAISPALEIVGQLLDQTLGHGHLAQGGFSFTQAKQTFRQAEMHQRGFVGSPGEAGIAERPLPLGARGRRLSRRLQLDRGQNRMFRRRQYTRRLRVVAQLGRAQRPLERPLTDRKVSLGIAKTTQRQQHLTGFDAPAERLIRAEHPFKPAVVDARRLLHASEQRSVKRQRVARTLCAQGAIGAFLQVHVVACRHRST